MSVPVELSADRSPHAGLQAMRRALRSEAALALVLFAIATVVGTKTARAFAAAGVKPSFYQPAFGPAVLVGCGRAFAAPDLALVPALDAFLHEVTDVFDCSQLPEPVATVPLDSFQRTSRYLELLVGVVWRFTSVSWSGLAILSGMLFGAVTTLTYGILRLALSRSFALLALIPSVTSTPHLALLPHLRDYAKGPFLLAAILIMGWLATAPAGSRRPLALSALAGVIAGVGLGVRTDLIIAIVPLAIAMTLLIGGAAPARVRIAAVALFLITFSIAALPIVRGYARGGNTSHVALLGLSADFDSTLRVSPSIYEFAGAYNDSLVFSIVNGFAVRVHHRHDGLALESPEYERMAREYLGRVAAAFPSDVATRIVGAIRVVPAYFLDRSLSPPAPVTSPFTSGVYRVRASVLSRLAPFALPAVVAALVAAAFASWRYAALGALVLGGFAGASALQFHERHFYYLQFVPWMAFAVLAEIVYRRREAAVLFSWRRALAVATATLLLAVCAVVAFAVLRAVQQRAAERLFALYESASRTALAIDERPARDGRSLLTTTAWQSELPAGQPWIQSTLLAIELRRDRCRAESVTLTARYTATYRDADLSHDVRAPVPPPTAPPTTVVIPIYDRADGSIRFRGIELDAADVHCVNAVTQVEGARSMPLLLTTTLPPGWRTQSLFQRFR